MRRAERLFRLVQILRAAGGLRTAAQIGTVLEVSKRTVYRDIAHLQGSGLPIDGEAGVGYLLRPGFDLPPMTFTTEQIEALVLGIRLVKAVGDEHIAVSVQEVCDKLEAVLPRAAARRLTETPFYAVADKRTNVKSLPALRRAIRVNAKIRIAYERLDGEMTSRTLRPLALICFGPMWLLTAWCERRGDFRNFRTDRIADLVELDETFADESGRRLADYKQTMAV